MNKKNTKIDTRQLDLFEFIARMRTPSDGEGRMNVRDPLRRALNQAIKEYRGSRYDLAGAMSNLLGVQITKAQIDSWTAESKSGYRIPAEYIPAFCTATKNQAPLIVLNETAGNFSIPGPEALRAEMERFADEEKRARTEKRKRKLLLDEMQRGGINLPGERRQRKGRRKYD